jgi:hypothetical protein
MFIRYFAVLTAACGLAACASDPPPQAPINTVVVVRPAPAARTAAQTPSTSPSVSPRSAPRETATIPPQPEATPTSPSKADQPRKPDLTDAAIVQLLIRASLATYSGNCPCPYNVDRAGRQCGGRSAYARPGGRSPLCYPGDIKPEMIEEYRKRHASAGY